MLHKSDETWRDPPTLFRPLPIRPLTDRDYIIVQDYVRVLGGADGNGFGHNWFFTYNHDFEHPYFAPRPGFVRSSVKYQGMVGVLGDNGKTRLTWLVNFDFKGLIPSSFTIQVLVTLMAYPVATIEAVEKEKQQSSMQKIDGDVGGEPGGGDAEAEASLSSTSALLETIAKLKAQRKKDSSKISRLEAGGKKYLSDISGLEAQGKRDALKISEDALKISGLEGEVSTLRRRLARLRAGEDEEHHGE